mmetsp:Transcript_29745/g.74915  ORF Transcript_29745/g.74915 Transcript_29745/m.74915 type:complete len:204 (-) Transcript_29745:2832-3443(-)
MQQHELCEFETAPCWPLAKSARMQLTPPSCVRQALTYWLLTCASPGGWKILAAKRDKLSSLAFGTILQLFDRDHTILQVPLLVANPLHEVRLGLNHEDATTESVQSLCEGLHRLNVQVIGGLVDGDEVRLGPKHGCEGEPHLLTGREAPDLTVAAHLLVDAKGLTMPNNLTPRQRPLIKACSLRSNALVARDDDLVEAHHLEL